MNDYAVIIAARMTSTRLPRKALSVYCPDGTPNLLQIVRRWQTSRRDPVIIVAATTDTEDNAIDDLCHAHGIPCYRGDRDNVLQRMNEALLCHAPGAQWVARGMSDSPLVDMSLADWRLDMVRAYGADGFSYGGGEDKITYAGTTDVWSRAAWDRIVSESRGDEHEHVGAYYWRNISRFNYITLPFPRAEYLAPLRTELDTVDDLIMFMNLFYMLGENVPDTYRALCWLLDNGKHIIDYNASVPLKTQNRAVLGKGSRWVCRSCQQQMGAVVAGNLEVHCDRCGKPQKFYAVRPERVRPSMMTVAGE